MLSQEIRVNLAFYQNVWKFTFAEAFPKIWNACVIYTITYTRSHGVCQPLASFVCFLYLLVEDANRMLTLYVLVSFRILFQ